MALVIPGLVGKISGVLGGGELAIAGGRVIAKRQKRRQGPATWRQMRAYSYHAKAIAHWKGLSAEDRLAWSIAAETRLRRDRLGTLRSVNGFQLFMTMPHNWGYTGVENWQDVPPTEMTPEPVIVQVYALIPRNLTVNIQSGTEYDFDYSSVLISRFMPTGSMGKAFTFFDTGLIPVTYNLINFYSPLFFDDVTWVLGETLKIRITMWTLGRWPRKLSYKSIIVGD